LLPISSLLRLSKKFFPALEAVDAQHHNEGNFVVNIIPGWDSIAGTHWWSNFYFWASITALILLGVMEVVSHRYSERKDELTAIEQKTINDANEYEIARLHNEAARLTAEAEASRAEIADAKLQMAQANLQASEANRRTEELRADNLSLQAVIAPRRLTADECQFVAESMKPFSGKRVRVQSYAGDAEGSALAAQIIDCLEAAKAVKVDRALASIMPLGGFGSGIFVDGSDTELAGAIRKALSGSAKLAITPGSGSFAGNIGMGTSEAPDANVLVGVKPVPTITVK
jgi:hypothetical protein